MKLITDFAIAAAAATAMLTLLDLLLSEPQKKRLSNWSIYLWDWIDDTRRKRLARAFNNGWTQLILIRGGQVLGCLFMLSGALIAMFGGMLTSLFDWTYLITFVIFNISIADFVGRRLLPPVLIWTTAAKSELMYTVRWYVVLQIVYLIGGALLLSAVLAPELMQYKVSAHPLLLVVTKTFAALVQIPIAVSFMTLNLIGTLTLITAIGIFTLRVLFLLLEFFFRRIAESPKGPILAASAVVATVAAFVRGFI